MNTKSFNSFSRYHNYGHLIKFFCSKSQRWIEDTLSECVDLSDKNTKSIIKHYIDGSDYMTIKSIFLKIIDDREIKFDISEVDKFPVYVKPSHAFIGGGKNIFYIETKEELMKLNLNPLLNYFFDPKIEYTPPMYDCRTYGILYICNEKLSFFLSKRGFKRTETVPNFTNLSLIEEKGGDINEFMSELETPLVNKINKEIEKIFKKKFKNFFNLYLHPYTGFLILGFDTMFSNSKVNFIEVNNSPVMIANKANIEGIITYDIFEDLIEHILFNDFESVKSMNLVYNSKVVFKKGEIIDFKKFYTPITDNTKRNSLLNSDEYI